jgi:hypothetical protein
MDIDKNTPIIIFESNKKLKIFNTKLGFLIEKMESKDVLDVIDDFDFSFEDRIWRGEVNNINIVMEENESMDIFVLSIMKDDKILRKYTQYNYSMFY